MSRKRDILAFVVACLDDYGIFEGSGRLGFRGGDRGWKWTSIFAELFQTGFLVQLGNLWGTFEDSRTDNEFDLVFNWF